MPADDQSTRGPADPAGVARSLQALRDELGHLERNLVAGLDQVATQTRGVPPPPGGSGVVAGAERSGPSWQRAHAGESRLPVALVMVVAIALQVALPDRLQFGPVWLLPGLEFALLAGLVVANPRRIDRTSSALRAASVLTIAVISAANAWSSGHLIQGLVAGTEGNSAGPLLVTGGSIYVTNIIVFGLWYWEWDRGGAVARAQARRPYPDFLFPQMTQPHLAPDGWVPTFLDYLYTSFTNATAFSPTDTMPLSLWSKMLMLVQSAVSLITVALVIARAVNILK